MVLTTGKSLIKSLQTLPRGVPLGSNELQAIGVSSALASHYVKSGWLERLGRGVFKFPGDELKRDATLKFLAGRMQGLHIGGKTALAWRGVVHNVPVRETLFLWGKEPGRPPNWFSARFPARYVARKLFDRELPEGFGLSALPENPDGPLVSEPERALLEMLSDVGIGQSVEEARHIMEGVRALRVEALEPLLHHCLRVKVVRLCVQWSEQLNLNWAAEARRVAKETPATSSSRWTARLKDGTTLILKP